MANEVLNEKRTQVGGSVGGPREIRSELIAIERAPLSWRAIFAGAFMALLFHAMLLALGLGLGGSSLRRVIEMGGGQGLGIGAGIWMVLSIVIALFFGSYFAGRISGLISSQTASIQGLVIAALFFGVMLAQVGSVAGNIGRGVGAAVGAMGTVAANVASDPRVQAGLQKALNGLALRSPPNVVLQGIVNRLIAGDERGARNYLAREARITPAEADRRITTIKNDIQKTLTGLGGNLASAVSTAGWTLFLALVLGTVSSALGGGVGASLQLRRPLSTEDIESLRKRKAA